VTTLRGEPAPSVYIQEVQVPLQRRFVAGSKSINHPIGPSGAITFTLAAPAGS